MEEALNRTDFLKLTGALGAGLGLAIYLPGCSSGTSTNGGTATTAFAPNAWVRVAPDNAVTIVINKSEMGQGVYVGLPTILADELDADWNLVHVEIAPPDQKYIDPVFGTMITGGSTSVADMYTPLRTAGATARAMLVTAAAQQWSVDPSACTTSKSTVYHSSSNRSATYGSLVDAASKLAVPTKVDLKTPDRFTLIGKTRTRLDIPLKVNGSCQYGLDVRLPGMMYASIARSPVFGGSVKSFDATKAKAVPGVVEVVQISNGVAVVAKNTWAAFQGKDALQVTWDDNGFGNVSTASLFADAERLARTHHGELVQVTRGNPNLNGGTVVEAEYRGPFLAHATMEPMNATADVRADSAEVWAPNQVQLRSQQEIISVTGFPPEKCILHTTFLGGGFGRRLESDYVREAVEVSKAIKAPVKVTWTREDDIQHDFYRPMSLNVVRGVVQNGKVVAFSHLVVAKSWLHRYNPKWLTRGIDTFALTETYDAPYYFPNFRVSYIDHEHEIPIGSWRAPDANWNGFVTESFMDELAHAANRDPLEFRLAHMEKNPRGAATLRLAAEKAGWGQKKPGIAQGLAVIFWFGSYAAIVADVSMNGNTPKVHHVVAAIDCGTQVTPDILKQQAQGATNFGLSAALTGNITIDKGRCQQNNFYDYTVLRMADAPVIDAYLVPSNEKPTGVGEICVPPIGPAVGNAIFALTGKRVRQLPFSVALA